MKKYLLLSLAIVLGFHMASSQILCIYCFDQNDSISNNVTNLIVNGSFENTNCVPNSNGNSWCPNSVNYNCNLNNWTCTGGGASTYCQVFTNLYSAIPDGVNAAYFGNSFCDICSTTPNDTSCLIRNNCEVTGVPPGFPINDAQYGGTSGLSLSQTVNGLTVGNTYVLEFWSGGEDFNVFLEKGIFGLDVGFGYNMLETVPTDNGDIGKTYVVIWTATATSHTITFTNWGHICSGCSELTLDLVRLYPVSQLDPSVNPCIAAPFAVTITSTPPNCNGNCDGEATANPVGSTAPYSYLWSNGQTTQTITGLCAGTYSVTVVSAANDTAMASVTITDPPQLTVSATSTPSDCNASNGTATANASGGSGPLTYSWSPSGQNTVTATGLPGGTQTVTVTDTNGCSASASVTVGQAAPPDPSWALITAGNCFNTTPYIFNATGNNPVGTTYSWTFQGGTPATANVANPQTTFSQGGSHTVTLTVTFGLCSATLTQQIAVPGIPVAEAGLGVSFCEGDGGAMLTGSASGGASPYYYSWWCDTVSNPFCGLDSVNDNDPIANPTSSGWYYLQVTGDDGCQSQIDSVYITVLAKPIVDAGPDVGICQPPAPGTLLNATVLNLQDAPGPYVVYWLPSAGLNNDSIFSPFARPDTTTIYTAVVISSNGCSSASTTTDTLSTVTVTVHPQPVANAGPDIHTCLTDSTMIQGTGTNAGPVYDYEWTPFAGLNNPSIPNPTAAPGFTHEYTLVVWSNGCPSIGDTMTLWVHTLPSPSAGNVQEICLGDSAQLDAFGAGDSSATYTYVWTPGNSLNDATLENPLASPDTSTVYYLVVTSNWGCDSPVDSVLVRVKPTPIAEAGPHLTICEGDSIQLPGSYYYASTDSADPSQIYYSWIPGASLQDTTLAQPWAWPTQSTQYFLAVRYNTCLTVDSMIVSVIPTDVPTVMADTTVACKGQSIPLHASGGLGNASFTWTPAAGLDDPTSPNPVATPDTTTTYYLVMEEGGCITQGAVTIAIIPSPTASFLSSGQTGCIPFPVSFQSISSDFIQYIWNFGDGEISNVAAPAHTYATPGDYVVTLTVVNTGGCEASMVSSPIQVVDTLHPDFTVAPAGDPAATGTPLELFLPNGNVLFHDISGGPVAEWHWDFGDGQTSVLVDPIHNYLQPGMYFPSLVTTNAFGCVSSVTHGPIVIKIPDLFIPNVFSPNGDGIDDVFLVEYKGSQPFNLEVFDRWGVLIHQSRNKEDGWKGRNTKGLDVAEGVYFYTVKIGEKGYTGEVTLVR